MKNEHKIVIALCAVIFGLIAPPVFAEQADSPIPYGGYRKEGRCGCYGAQTVIKTAEEARKVIEQFLVGHDWRIGTMQERPNFFMAELVDRSGAVRDVVIVHKANGRVRSTY